MPKDIVGQELAVQDTVVYNPPYAKGLSVGVVTKLTDRTVTIQTRGSATSFITHNRPIADVMKSITHIRPIAGVMKVDPNYAIMYHLRAGTHP